MHVNSPISCIVCYNIDMKNSFPQSVQATLWSYNGEGLDKDHDKDLIIFQVLNFGTEEAVAWLNQEYSRDDIEKTIQNSTKNSWSQKSLNYWSLILGVTPKRTSRFA